MAIEKIVVPDIGGAEGAEVIEVLVTPGDEVSVDQGLIVLESDKASMEIPATVAGKVIELLAAVGDELAEGAPLAMIERVAEPDTAAAPTEQEPAADVSRQAAQEEPLEAVPAAVEVPTDSESVAVESVRETEAAAPTVGAGTAPQAPVTGTKLYAGPAVRKLAREFGIPLEQVHGSGPQGRILKDDLHRYSRRSLQEGGASSGAGLPQVPEIDFSRFGEIETTSRTKLDRLTATNMQRSWLNVPHVTQFDEADITDLEAFRAQLKGEAESRETRLTPLPFLIKACAIALRDNPKLNTSLTGGGEELVWKKYIHIGMAVDTPLGLMVPVIRDVDRKSIWQLAEEVMELAAKARERKLAPQDMQGGCFTVSSLGAIGGTGFTPIINTPEVAILGVSKAATKPVWNGVDFEPRKMLPLALSYDHRVVNGGDGGRFFTRVVALLSDIRQLSL